MNNNNDKKPVLKRGGCGPCARARAARLAKIKAEQEAKAAAAKKTQPKPEVVKQKEEPKIEETKMDTIDEEPCEYCDEVKE